jgi:flagellin-like protein
MSGKENEAVSPVVGVMLMLVVTIILAAVVSGFAGGLAGSQEVAPQASIAVSTGYAGDNFDIKFEHLGGDPIKTSDCEFITYLTLPNGTVVKHTQTGTSPLARSETPVLKGTVYTYSRGPHLTDPQKYAYPCSPIENESLSSGWTVEGINSLENGENYAWFGDAVWLSGDVARTYNNGYTANFVGLVDYVTPDSETGDNPFPGTDNVYDSACSLLKECVDNNCNLDIKLMHIPSGKYILDKSIILQG